jgi:hypothetical protein
MHPAVTKKFRDRKENAGIGGFLRTPQQQAITNVGWMTWGAS